MKYIINTIFLLVLQQNFAQCNFEIIDYKGSKINALPREMFVLKENHKALTGDYVLFSLFTDGVTKRLITTFSRVARRQFLEFCFNKTSFLRFTFKDGTFVKLLYEGEELCKKQEKHPSRKKFNTLKIETQFKISQNAFLRLKEEKVKTLTIVGKGGVSFTYEAVKKISADASLNETSYPISFFQNKLPCLEFD